MNRTNYLIRLLAPVLVLVTAACGETTPHNTTTGGTPGAPVNPASISASTLQTGSLGGAINLQPPAALLQNRMVNPDRLSPTVTVIPGGIVEMSDLGSSQWSGAIQVPVNSQVSISIEWFESLESGEDLILASHRQNFSIGQSPQQVSIDNSIYNTSSHDDDNDGVSNLEERRASTNPFDANQAPPPLPGSTDVSLVIPLVNNGSVPQIDGLGAAYAANELRLAGEWVNAAQDSLNGELFVNSPMIQDTSDVDNDPFHVWAALHDGSFLYILVMVDDSGANQGDSPQIRDDDSIEIFIDGNNSNNESYGDPDDRYFRIALIGSDGVEPHTNESANPRIERGENSADLPGNVEFATGRATGPLSIANPGQRLDVYEVKLELASFGITTGQPFGIEVQINDDDNGEIRDLKWGWAHPPRRGSDLNLTVSNPAFMGTARLSQ